MKGLPRSLARGPAQQQRVRKHRIVVRDATITVAGAIGVGFGSAVIGDLPEGNILILGAVSYMQFTGPTSASLSDTWAGDYGVGTTPPGDATLSGADIDIIGSTALAAATAEASPRTRGVSVTATDGAVLDNTDGSLEVNLGLLVDDADISADGIVVTANGEVEILYSVMLDD